MNTHVDHNTLRPYFNSGYLIVRPERGLFQKWWDYYKKIYCDPDFDEFYEKNDLYRIFIHQAVLSAVVISTLKREELQELSFYHNYPLHLFEESPVEYRYKNSQKLITARYYLNKLSRQGELEKIGIQEPLKNWLKEQLSSEKSQSSSKLSNNLKKVKFGKTPIIYPIPIILAGALVNDKPNFEEIGDVGIMGLNPALVYISSGKNHYTNKGILQHQTFSINIPTTKMLAKTDYCGTVSGEKVDKSELFEIFYGELRNAPMIKECPVNLECEVVKEFSIQHRQVFVGEVIQAYVNEEFVIRENDKLRISDMRKLDPIIYALDNRYYKIGKPIGTGYQESKKFPKKRD
ncbi:MAG: hypothetical protein GF308_09350 [Candidatus Heimdallarchaeota archaeon]|nr:hypothetical protein [Candidatus Heimdallarchaeota archaeon]